MSLTLADKLPTTSWQRLSPTKPLWCAYPTQATLLDACKTYRAFLPFATNTALCYLSIAPKALGTFPWIWQKRVSIWLPLARTRGFSIMGAGALIFGEHCVPRPIKYGGTGTESHLVTQPTTLPESLESGTLPIPAIVSMGQGAKWYVQNHSQISQHIAQMQQLLLEGLSRVKGVAIFSKSNPSEIGRASCRERV